MSDETRSASKPDYTVFATNKQTKFKDFSIKLSNVATLTGISHIPISGYFLNTKHKPLLIGIHDATCSAYSWDVSREYTASIYSELLGVPFVAFNRPNFLGSTGWLRDSDRDEHGKRFEMPEGSSRYLEEARWWHEYIFPALWQGIGVANGCTAIVTNSHSMSVPMTIITANHYGNGTAAQYPWAGMVISGFGEERLQVGITAVDNWPNNAWQPKDLPLGHDPSIHIGPFLKPDKIALMLGPPGCCEPQLEELCWRQNTPFLLGEVIDMVGLWIGRKEEFKSGVRIPVMYGLGTMEWLWKADREHVSMFLEGFKNARRIEGGLVEGAPHAIEWSRVSGGWWVRVMGWAVEVTGSLGVEGMGLKQYE